MNKAKESASDTDTPQGEESKTPVEPQNGSTTHEDEGQVEMQENDTLEEETQDLGTKNFQGESYNFKPIDRKMPLMTDDEYIRDRLDNQISWYDRKSSLNQKRYKKLKKIEIIIAATIPVVTSLGALVQDETIETTMLVSAAVAGIILVVINKNIELEDYFRFWKEYRAACEALQYERSLYLTRTEPYDEEDAFPRLVEKVESILSKETQKWQARVKQPQVSDLSAIKKADTSKLSRR